MKNRTHPSQIIMPILLIWALFSASLATQSPIPEQQERLRNEVYQAFISGDIPRWEQALGHLENYYQQHPLSSILYDLLLARYGYMAMLLGNNDNSRARAHLSKGEEELEQLFRYPSYISQAYALQGAFLGFRISLRPITAVRLGPASYRAIDNALEANPNNPTAWMERGNSRFYTPSTFGGSKQEALESYLRAVALFEANLTSNHRWLYLNTLIGLARSYEYTNNKQMAIKTFQKALQIEPDFLWVKNELLPQALGKNP